MRFFEELFKGYDIRGIYPQQLTENICIDIGKALGSLAVQEGLLDVVISNDGSKNAVEAFNHVLQGLSATPIKLTTAVPTIPSAVLYSLATNRFKLGVYVSHGHAVDDQVIFRITRSPISPFNKKDFEFIKNSIDTKTFISGIAEVSTLDLLPDYENFLLAKFSNLNGLRIMLGLGDVITQKVFPTIFNKLSITVDTYDAKDDTDLKVYSEQTKESEPDLSVYIDYGAEIFHVLDESGHVYDNDKVLMVFADSILHKNPGKKILFDVKSTELLTEFIEFRGGSSKRIKTGYPHFISEMEKGAILGGEFSGNIYFKDNYFGYDDHVFTILRLLERIYETKRPLSYIMQTFPMRVHSDEIKLPCPNDLKYGLMDTLLTNFRDLPDVKDIDDTDGVRIKVTATGWFLIRASNTGPFISVRIEGLYEKEAYMILERVKSVLVPFVFVDTKALNEVELVVS